MEASTGALTIFDWVVIVVVGLSALLALFRGFVREVLSLAAWLVAAFVTVNYYETVGKLLEGSVNSPTARLGLSTVGLFLVILILAAIVNSIIIRFLQAGGDIGMLDSLLGMLFGVLRGVFIVSLVYLMCAVVFEKELPEWLDKARTRPVVHYGATVLTKLAPKYAHDLRVLSKEAAEKGQQINELQQQEQELERLRKGDGAPRQYDSRQMERLLNGLEEKAAPASE